MSEAPNTPRANRLWAALIVEELIRNGVSLFCVAPGSRSTPLAAAIAENPKARSLIHFDERGTAFAALGYARATEEPAAWITTSGTAVANGLPAIVEVATDTVPMLVLTADRPPELRQTGANQTIVQPGIFGEYARWNFDLPAPDSSVDPATVLTTVDQATYRARRSPQGPVHLNLMFREPFLPEPDVESDVDYPTSLDRWIESGEPYTRYAATEPAVDTQEIQELWASLRSVERGLIIAGRLKRQEDGEAVVRLAETLNWPLLADIGSQVRLGAGSENRIAYYDALLADERFWETHMPEAVLQFGGPPVSKRLQQFLARSRPNPFAVVRENPFRIDPNHVVTQSVEANVSGFCDALTEVVEVRESRYADLWREASRRIDLYLDETFSESSELSEPLVARLVTHHILEDHGLVVASSMPIRDVDTFAATDGPNLPVAANRGVSGIDGTVATTAGFARGLGRPATLLIGDLALLHDLNSLAMLREMPVVVVVLNNDGGGIFEFLPVSGHREFFELYFGTPQGVSFEHAAEMFGIAYERPRTAVEFEESYRAACERDGPSLIEVKTDRKENVALHRRILSGITGQNS